MRRAVFADGQTAVAADDLDVQMLDTLMTMHPTRKAVQMMPTSLILFSRFLMTIAYRFFLFNFCIYSS